MRRRPSTALFTTGLAALVSAVPLTLTTPPAHAAGPRFGPGELSCGDGSVSAWGAFYENKKRDAVWYYEVGLYRWDDAVGDYRFYRGEYPKYWSDGETNGKTIWWDTTSNEKGSWRYHTWFLIDRPGTYKVVQLLTSRDGSSARRFFAYRKDNPRITTCTYQ
jgi:hypothetical protein